jgi:hypothetical protein
MNFIELYLAITLALLTSQGVSYIVFLAWMNDWFTKEQTDA